jgi:hypothetical protein
VFLFLLLPSRRRVTCPFGATGLAVSSAGGHPAAPHRSVI